MTELALTLPTYRSSGRVFIRKPKRPKPSIWHLQIVWAAVLLVDGIVEGTWTMALLVVDLAGYWAQRRRRADLELFCLLLGAVLCGVTFLVLVATRRT